MSNVETIRSKLDTPEFWGQNTIAPKSNLDNFWDFISYLWFPRKIEITEFEQLFCGVDKIQFPVTIHSLFGACKLVDSLGKKYVFDITSSQALHNYKYSILEENDKITLGWYFKVESGKIFISKTSYSNTESNISYVYEAETMATFEKGDYSIQIVYPNFGHNRDLEDQIWEIFSTYFIIDTDFTNVFKAFEKIIDIFKNADLKISNLKISSSGPDADVPLLSKIELKEGLVEKYIYTVFPDESCSLLHKHHSAKTLENFLNSRS